MAFLLHCSTLSEGLRWRGGIRTICLFDHVRREKVIDPGVNIHATRTLKSNDKLIKQA
ncbi:MAG: hypothetical protein NZ954_02980 [Thermofilaceae archaeon]|nr:hypothetical protein [Thermofilaceae archaeon]MDW8004501.1 hypothetical protein [Thermofilaceae archaeon]